MGNLRNLWQSASVGVYGNAILRPNIKYLDKVESIVTVAQKVYFWDKEIYAFFRI